MNPANNEPASYYQTRLRQRTVYPVPRSLISLLFWLSLVAIVLVTVPSLWFTWKQLISANETNFMRLLFPVGMLLSLGVYVMLLILARYIALAYFDAVDCLLESNRKKKEPNNAMQPTPVDVTDRADARSAPSTSVADL